MHAHAVDAHSQSVLCQVHRYEPLYGMSSNMRMLHKTFQARAVYSICSICRGYLCSRVVRAMSLCLVASFTCDPSAAQKIE